MVNHVNRGISEDEVRVRRWRTYAENCMPSFSLARGSDPAKDRLLVPIQYFAIFSIESGDEKNACAGLVMGVSDREVRSIRIHPRCSPDPPPCAFAFQVEEAEKRETASDRGSLAQERGLQQSIRDNFNPRIRCQEIDMVEGAYPRSHPATLGVCGVSFTPLRIQSDSSLPKHLVYLSSACFPRRSSLEIFTSRVFVWFESFALKSYDKSILAECTH